MPKPRIIIELSNRVSCLPGYENFNIATLQLKPRKKFVHKSTQELLHEKALRENIVVWKDEVLQPTL